MSTPAPVSRIDTAVARIARSLIRWRKPLALLFMLITIGLGLSATRTHLDPGFNKLIPHKHEYMAAFQEYASVYSGANRVLVSVQWKGPGDIYNPAFLKTLQGVTDDVFFTPGVSRGHVLSLFTPNVRYIEVTEDGFVGEVIVPSHFVADAEGLRQVRSHVAKSGVVGRLVANDFKSALVQADLLEVDPQSGKKLDYSEVARKLEQIRAKYSGDQVDIQIIGFSKVVGDVMDGLVTVVAFFGVAFAITALLLWLYARSKSLTVVALLVAMLPVVWLLGLLPLIGLGIDPMSILVPFLIFSIGVSHAVQMTNAWKQEAQAGLSSERAAESAFRKLAIPGSVALVTNALGFMVIMLIDIPIVHELGVTACLGVLLMIATNKMLLPIVLSYLRPAPARVARCGADGGRHRGWWAVSAFAEPRIALWTLATSLLLLATGTIYSRHLQTGDIGAGVPELHAASRYNRDNEQIVRNYSIGMDTLSVYLETRGMAEACLQWPVMNAVDRFDFFARGIEGVRSVTTVAGLAKLAAAANNEANPRWATLQRSEAALRTGARVANPELGLNTEGCSSMHLTVYLKDHQDATLKHVVGEIRKFIAADQTPNVRFRLAGGNAGIAIATNEAVERAEVQMLAAIFGAITLLCWVSFRSWKAVVCIIIPLMLVSILCNALMAILGIGLKVSTLPVIALGVGVGVDYGIYLYERMQHEIKYNDAALRQAFYEAMRQRGTAAVFTGITMSLGVGTWAFSALKFQADMGILLAFMFLVNLLGAVFLLPALACWLDAGKQRKSAAPVRHPDQVAQGRGSLPQQGNRHG